MNELKGHTACLQYPDYYATDSTCSADKAYRPLQMAVSRLFHLAGPLPPAPLPLIFASFVPFLLDIPPSSKFSFMGWSFTDKVRVVYVHASHAVHHFNHNLTPA